MVRAFQKKIKNKIVIVSLLLLSLFFSGCGCSSIKNEKKYYIGIDPSFYPLGLGLLGKQTYGFSQELLLEMAEEMNIRFFVIQANWDNLFSGLEADKYKAVFSSKYPYVFSKDKYNFSNVFLETGPSLVVRKGADNKLLDMLDGKLVGYIKEEDSIFILEKHPNILVKDYDSMAVLLEDVSNGHLEAAIVNSIQGSNFVNNLYGNSLVINPPLTDEGIRLISLNKDEEIIKMFNKGLDRLEKKGIVTKLKRKWGLN